MQGSKIAEERFEELYPGVDPFYELGYKGELLKERVSELVEQHLSNHIDMTTEPLMGGREDSRLKVAAQKSARFSHKLAELVRSVEAINRAIDKAAKKK